MFDNEWDIDPATQVILTHSVFYATRKEVADALEAMPRLVREARLYIANKMEKELDINLVGDPDETAEHIQKIKEKVLDIEGEREQNLIQSSDEIGGFVFSKNVLLMTRFILENKGDEASPFIHLYVDEINKLSPDELKLPENAARAACIALEKIRQWPEIQARRLAEKAEKEREQKSAQQREKAIAAFAAAKNRLEKLKSHCSGKIVLKRN